MLAIRTHQKSSALEYLNQISSLASPRRPRWEGHAHLEREGGKRRTRAVNGGGGGGGGSLVVRCPCPRRTTCLIKATRLSAQRRAWRMQPSAEEKRAAARSCSGTTQPTALFPHVGERRTLGGVQIKGPFHAVWCLAGKPS